MTLIDDFCPSVAPLGVLQTAPDRRNCLRKPRTHDAYHHKQHCRFCKRKEQGKCKRLAAECEACRDDLRAAGPSTKGSITTLPPSPRAIRSRKRTRVERDKRQEDGTEVQVDDNGEEDGELIHFSEEVFT